MQSQRWTGRPSRVKITSLELSGVSELIGVELAIAGDSEDTETEAVEEHKLLSV